MFYPFKPGTRPRQATSDPGTDQLATRIFNKSLKLQIRCADYLGERAKKLPGKILQATLITWAVGAGSYSLYLIASGFWGKPPEHIFPSVTMQLPLTGQVASGQSKEQVFEAYLDSLEKAFIRDSINESNLKK